MSRYAPGRRTARGFPSGSPHIAIEFLSVEWSGIFAVVGGAVLCVLLVTIADLAGWIALDEIKRAVFRRESFAKRSGRYRGLSLTAYVLGALAGLAGFLGVTAATSGVASDAPDATLLFTVAAALAATAAIFFVAWWRMAGKPRHY